MIEAIAALKAALSWIQNVEPVDYPSARERIIVDEVTNHWTHVPWNPIAIKLTCEQSHHCLTDHGWVWFDSEQFQTIVWMITQCISEGKHLMSIQKDLYEYCFTPFSDDREGQINWLLYGICEICANCTRTDTCKIEHEALREADEALERFAEWKRIYDGKDES